jgi:hypothetical protein
LEQLKDALDGSDFTVESYSGRCMYGAYCAGITVDHSGALLSIGARLAQSNLPYGDILNFADSMSQDSMGKGVVFYWQYLKVERGDEDDDEEDDD